MSLPAELSDLLVDVACAHERVAQLAADPGRDPKELRVQLDRLQEFAAEAEDYVHMNMTQP